MNNSDSDFSISNSNFKIISNNQSNILEVEKNISFSFCDSDFLNLSNFKSTLSAEEKMYLLDDDDIIDNEIFYIFNESKIKCNENCKIQKINLFYLFNICYIEYSCYNNHKGIIKFNDFFENIKFFDNEKEEVNLDQFVLSEKIKDKYEKFKGIKNRSNEILNMIDLYKKKLDEIYKNKKNKLELIKNEYTKKYKKFSSFIKYQIKLCEKQFYYFQNLINNNKFNKDEFDNLNILNFKNIEDILILFNEKIKDNKLSSFDKKIKNNMLSLFNKIKDFNSFHFLTNFFKYCRESNGILKEKIINNDNAPNDYEKKLYEIFSQFKIEKIKDKNINLTNKVEKFNYFVFFKINNHGFLKFIKENKIYISDLNKNNNNELIEFYNEKDKFYGKWMNFANINDNNNYYNLDIFGTNEFYIGNWKKLNFNEKIIDCFYGYKVKNLPNILDIELIDFLKNKKKINSFKHEIKTKLDNILKEQLLKKRNRHKKENLEIDYKKKEIKYHLKKKEMFLIQTKNEIIKGEYKNNKFNGYVEIHYKNGNIFKGEIKNGKKNGFGIFYKIFYQIWEDDKKTFEISY